jgi:transcriptional regulator with XRE-family HTH domain
MRMETRGTVGGRLKWARDRRAWTQDDLARAAGVPILTVSRIERGRVAMPRQSTVRKLAGALGVDAGWLLTGEGSDVLGKLAA